MWFMLKSFYDRSVSSRQQWRKFGVFWVHAFWPFLARLYDVRSRISSPTYPNFVKSLITTAFPTLIAWLQQRTSLLFNSLIQRFWGPYYYCAATSCKIPVHHPYRLPKYGYTTNLRTTSQIQPGSCTVWWLRFLVPDYEGLANATVWICSSCNHPNYSRSDILEWSSWTILSFHVTWNRGTQRNISENMHYPYTYCYDK